MLKEHLLPRMKRLLQIEADAQVSGGSTMPVQIFFKGERMYSHKIARFNYTTYDVRRAQDVVNPATSHCNVMLLSEAGSSFASEAPLELEASHPHPYLYARVIGIYHANVIYTGPGMLDYTPHRMDFLWVRWYNYQDAENTARLGRLSFPPITSDGAFGFVDPADVIRGCHVIPRFSQGKQYPTGTGFSRLAHDSHDWTAYHISRYVSSYPQK